jgi:hypothetical protein
MSNLSFYNIDKVDIPFSYDWKKICISISGGADSALLGYLLADIFQKNKLNIEMHVISHTRCWKTKPWQRDNSMAVYKWLCDRFPNITFKRYENFIAPDLEYAHTGPNLTDEYGKKVSGDNIEIRAFAEYVCDQNQCEAYYNGVTRNPRNISLGGMRERDIEINEDNKHLQIMRHMNKWALHPLRFVEKDWVVQQYMTQNIQDLFDITRSCEGEIQGINHTNYVSNQYVPECGECFWCKERKWAIEKIK